jgi:DHA1 family tetracycline resistance protein-like MFS transporter
VAVQGPVLGWVSRYVADRTLIVAGGLILTLGFRLFDTHATGVIYLGVALMALGNGVMWPSVLSALSNAAGDTYQGAVQGFAGSLGAVASIAGLVVGGIAYATLGPKVFWTSAAIILVGAAIGAYPSYPAGGARRAVSVRGA